MHTLLSSIYFHHKNEHRLPQSTHQNGPKTDETLPYSPADRQTDRKFNKVLHRVGNMPKMEQERNMHAQRAAQEDKYTYKNEV
jgi:hypothetical protein